MSDQSNMITPRFTTTEKPCERCGTEETYDAGSGLKCKNCRRFLPTFLVGIDEPKRFAQIFLDGWVVIDPANISPTLPDADISVLGMDKDGYFHSVYWDGERFIRADTDTEIGGIFAWTNNYPDPIDLELREAEQEGRS